MNNRILREAAIVASDNYNILVGVYPRQTQKNYFYDPYFKVYNNKSQRSASKVARISIYRPEYIIHERGDLPMFVLGRKEIAFVLKVLRDPIGIDGKYYDRAWDYMCTFLTNTAKSMFDLNVDYRGIPIPDYTKLKY